MKHFLILLILQSLCFSFEGRVIKITDGDTITVLNNDKQQIKVRLWGIDAPEKKQNFGNKSKQFLSDLISGQIVEIDQKGIDRYGRTLGIVFLKDDINAKMVLNGYAWAYTKYSKYYAPLQSKAKYLKSGLWIDEAPMAPWDFRKNNIN